MQQPKYLAQSKQRDEFVRIGARRPPARAAITIAIVIIAARIRIGDGRQSQPLAHHVLILVMLVIAVVIVIVPARTAFANRTGGGDTDRD